MSNGRDVTEDVVAGVARVRPAVFPALSTPAQVESTPAHAEAPDHAARGSAARESAPARPGSSMGMPAGRRCEPPDRAGRDGGAEEPPRPATGDRRPATGDHEAAGSEGLLSRGMSALRALADGTPQTESGVPRRPTAIAGSAIGVAPGVERVTTAPQPGASQAPEATSPGGSRGVGRASRDRPEQPAVTELEQRLAPLRGMSRELGARGMPASLVAELMSEIVAEYGNQVLDSERDARLAFVAQLLQRIPSAPLVAPDGHIAGTYVVIGPAGAGKSVFIAHLALLAAQRGQQDVVLVNTESMRIGAAAQMNALGTVFGYQVEHAYTPHELRTVHSSCGPATLLLVETAGWSPVAGTETTGTPWKWQLPGAAVVVCVPATGQADDLQELLSTARRMTDNATAVLCKTTETRNVLPALGALAAQRQPVGMVVPGPNLAESPAPLDLGAVVRAALGVVVPQRKKGRVR